MNRRKKHQTIKNHNSDCDKHLSKSDIWLKFIIVLTPIILVFGITIFMIVGTVKKMFVWYQVVGVFMMLFPTLLSFALMGYLMFRIRR